MTVNSSTVTLKARKSTEQGLQNSKKKLFPTCNFRFSQTNLHSSVRVERPFQKYRTSKKKKKSYPPGTLRVPHQNERKIWDPQNKGPKYSSGGRKTQNNRSQIAWIEWNRKVKKAMWDHPRNQNAWCVWPPTVREFEKELVKVLEKEQ